MMAAFGPAMKKGSPLEDMGMGGEADEKVYSEQKEAVAREFASALGLDPETIDAQAVCDAMKKLRELE